MKRYKNAVKWPSKNKERLFEIIDKLNENGASVRVIQVTGGLSPSVANIDVIAENARIHVRVDSNSWYSHGLKKRGRNAS